MAPRSPTFADLVSDYTMRPKRPTPRHRADNHKWADRRARAADALAAARTRLREAWSGSGTPAHGLTLLADLQRHDGQTS